MAKSYQAVYRSGDGNTLLGGVLGGKSSRFQSPDDARLRLEIVQELHAPRPVPGEVVEVPLPPEILSHCPGSHSQAVGGRCFGCGKTLTRADALAAS